MPNREELVRRQKALGDFGDFVLDHDDLDQILNEGCRLIAQALGADLAEILEIEQSNDTALVRAGIGWNDGIVGQERISLSERSSEAFAIQQGEPVITKDIGRETRFHFPAFLKDHGVVALVNVPIFLPGRKPWGVLQVDAREPREFEQEDVEFLKTYSMVLGPVVDRLQKVTGLNESEARHAFLLRLSDELRHLVDAKAIQAATAQLVGEHLRVDRAMYGEAEGQRGSETGTIRGQYVRAAQNGSAIEPFPEHFTFADFGEEVMARRYRGEPIVVSDIDSAQGFQPKEREAWRAANVRSAIVIPLVKDDRLVTEFGVHCVKPREWTAAEVDLLSDVAERTWAAAERARAEEALRTSEEKYAGLFAAAPAPFLILRPDAPHFTIADVNDAYLAATMRTREDLVGRAMFDAFPDNPDDPAANGVKNLRASLERALVLRQFDVMDVQKYDIVGPKGTFEERWWKPANAPVVDVNGNVVAIIHHVADVTAEHRAVEALRASERHAQTLLAELQHRVRNILAMIRSVVRRTVHSKADVTDFVQHLEGRIDAMARTQALLTRMPARGVDLEDVVRDELISQAAADGKAAVYGPPVGLSPHAAELVTLAVHELATNSVKYGALGQNDGRVTVSWECSGENDKQRLKFTWHETGLSDGEPGPGGFGTELITQRVPYELRGTGDLRVGDGTLTVTIEFPLDPGFSILETQPSPWKGKRP